MSSSATIPTSVPLASTTGIRRTPLTDINRTTSAQLAWLVTLVTGRWTTSAILSVCGARPAATTSIAMSRSENAHRLCTGFTGFDDHDGADVMLSHQ